MNNELLYQIALTRVPNIGDIHARTLINIFGDASAIFNAPKFQLEKIEGIGSIRANCLKKFRDFTACENEMLFINRQGIQPLFLNQKQYPQKLLHCYDSPALLYYKGCADLNAGKIVSIVGTRLNDEYGKNITEKLVADLAGKGILVISGLAYGIDTIAHKAALKNNLPTVSVLAHGLDRVYPQQNLHLANQMTENGGILSEFMSGTNPDKQNFPKRNRIVAGICDALIVIQSGIKGGSLITAEIANSYNKDVFAFPGRVDEPKNAGSNFLIRTNRASLISNATEFLDMMNWTEKENSIKTRQRQLFIELTAEEKIIKDHLLENGTVSIDEIYLKSRLSSSAVAHALLMLEMNAMIQQLPGKMYKLI